VNAMNSPLFAAHGENTLCEKSLPGVNCAGQVCVCMVCYPKLSEFFAAFPHFQDCQVTSTFCARHFAEIKNQYAPALASQHN